VTRRSHERNRYGTHSVTGFMGPMSSRRPLTTWYVHDKADAHRVVSAHSLEAAARGEAVRLNKLEREWEAS
jgi:hypothetical protein